MDVGRYPTNAEGLRALLVAPGGLKGWKGPYVNQMRPDEWGRPVHYFHFSRDGALGGQEDSFEVISYGADGEPGGDGKDADISNIDSAATR